MKRRKQIADDVEAEDGTGMWRKRAGRRSQRAMRQLHFTAEGAEGTAGVDEEADMQQEVASGQKNIQQRTLRDQTSWTS